LFVSTMQRYKKFFRKPNVVGTFNAR